MRNVRFRDSTGKIRVGQWIESKIAFADWKFDPSEVDILPPVDPTKIIGVHTNYESVIADLDPSEQPDRPSLFVKPPNAVVGHGKTVWLPEDAEHITYEAELGVVIGRECRNVPTDEAMDVVSGFTCMNEMSNMDEENEARKKAFDHSAVIGPVVASPERVPSDAKIELRLNGERQQHASRSKLVFDVRELIADISSTITLEPGDVIATGTPDGWGYLSDGDLVEIQIEGIETLEHAVRIG